MHKLKRIETQEVLTVAKAPVWSAGFWNCGDTLIPDPSGTAYEVVAVYAPMTPMAFYLAFTPQERITIKASADAVVKEFWDTFQLALQTNTPIDPSLPSVTEGLAYLRGASILASDARVASILAGIPQ